MRLRKKSIIGKIDGKGRLKIPLDVLEDFCTGHPGRGVILRLEIMSKEPSEKTRGYFFGYVIPELQGMLLREYGERYTKSQTYDWLRKRCPLFLIEERENGDWRVRIRDFEELDQSEANEVVEWVVQDCAENFSTIIDYPE